jgi:hypothetical protein
VSAWREALDAADDVTEAHRLPPGSATTAWLDNRVGGRLGVRVTLPGGDVVTGTPREIGERVGQALAPPRRKRRSRPAAAKEAPAGEAPPHASPAGQEG